MNTVQDTRNNLLNRREIKVLVESKTGNPGFKSMTEMIAREFNANSEAIAVKNVKGKFGRDTFLVWAHLYDSVGDKLKIEPKPKVKKAAGGVA